MSEKEVFELIKKKVFAIQIKKEKPILIAINGIEGTGKTLFTKKLTNYLKFEKVPAIQVSIDGFHFNKEARYKQGRDSAIGYYEDSYNEKAFVQKVLLSSQEEIPKYTIAIHDIATDEYLELEPIKIEKNTILITDGAYLFKPNYRDHWDLKIYLKTSFEIAMRRGVERDKNILGGFESTKVMYKKRYHKSSQIYLLKNKPEEIADIIIDNSDFKDLKIIMNTL